MTMGGYDERFHTSPMVYSSRYGDGRFYTVHVRKIYLRRGSGGEGSMSSDPINEQVITLQISEDNLNNGNDIIESGSTDTVFSKRIATELSKAYEELSGHAYVSLSEEELHALPTILIQLAGDNVMNQQLYPAKSASISGLAGTLDPDHPYDVLLAIPPSHYMEYDDQANKYVARFYTDGEAGSILGANAMMGHDVLFDLDDKRIGWAESDCNYHELISNHGFVDLIHGGSTSVKPETTTPQSKVEQDHTTTGYDFPNDSTKMRPSVSAIVVGGLLIGFLALGLFVEHGCRNSANARYAAVEVLTSDLELTPSAFLTNNAEYQDDDTALQDDTKSSKKVSSGGYSDGPSVRTGYKDDADISDLRVV
jgi:hypothetical protein